MRDVRAVQGRGVRSLLRDRALGPFLAGKLLSSCGTWIQNLAAAVLMFDLTRSAFMVGMVSVLQFAGLLILALWAGALTDRLDRRTMLLGGRVVSGGAVAALATLIWVRGEAGFGGPPVLLAGVFLMGMGLAFSAPAMQALLPSLVPDEELEQALALNAAGPSIARTVGPATGAGLLLLGGHALAFGVAGLAHWTFAVVLLFIRGRPQRRPRSRPRILGGLGYLVRDRKAGVLMLGVAAIGFGADPVITLTPSLAARMGGGSELVGLFASAFGAGAVLATALFRALRRILTLRLMGVGGFWTLSCGLAISAYGPTAGLIATGFLVAGFGFMMATVALNTRIQRRVPDELRGRVMALWGVAFMGSRPFAAIVNGTISDLASVQTAVLTAAALTLVASLLARVSYRDRGGAPDVLSG